DDVQDQSIPSPTPPTPPPQPSQDIPSTSQVQSPSPQPQYLTSAQPQVAQDLEIIKLKTRVKKLEKANKVKALKLRRLRNVGTSQRVDTSDDTIMEDVSNQGRMIDELDRDEGVVLIGEKEEEKKAEEVKDITGDAQVDGRQAKIYQIDIDHAAKVLSMQEDKPEVKEVVEVVTTAKLITEGVTVASTPVSVASTIIPAAEPKVPAATITTASVKPKDKGKGIMVEEPKPMKKKEQVEMDEAYAMKLHEELNQDIDWDVAIDHVKQKAKEDPYVQRYQKAAKRRKMNKDVEDLKQHLEIVLDEDDDVYTEATPLARKVHVVDYQIVHFNNKPHYKIIRADGTHQLYWKFLIHIILQSMSAKRTSWNEFSSAMASTVICLSTGMLVAGEPEEQCDAEEEVWGNDNNAAQGADAAISGDDMKTRVKKLEKANKVKALKLKRLRKVGTSQRVDTSDDTIMKDVSNQGRMIDELDRNEGVVLISEKEEGKKAEEVKDITGDAQVEGRQAEIYQINMDHAVKVLSMQEDEPEVKEVVEVVTTAKLITEVVTAASIPVSVASTIIPADEPKVPAATITTAPVKVATASTRRRREVVEMDEAYARKLHEELNKDINWDVAIDHVKQKSKEDPYVQRYQVMKKIPQTEAQAQRNMIIQVQLKNIEFLLKSKEQLEEEENRALESINETPAQKAAKRRKTNEDVEDLKQHLEIVLDEDDDVYTEATPLARKVPIVDYQIVHFNNKPHYKIIRADGTHQLYVSFITLLKNFNREDLELLWNLVKERFSTSNPNNFFDDYLLSTLRAMFE
nr:hypothetical protein [Tanacetum cinerariifolium]